MSSARETWTLRRRGLTLSRIELLGADAVVVARIRPIDATRTDVEVVDGQNLRIDQWTDAMQIRDGATAIARASNGVLTVGSDSFEWKERNGPSRSAMVRSTADGTALLETRPGRDGPSRWATLEIHHDLPERLAVAVLASATLLRGEVASDPNGSWGFSSAGPTSFG